MKLKGSSLIFSFIVLSFLLVSALSVAVVSVTSRRSSLATKNSNVSFQVADSSAEVMLRQIYQDNNTITSPAVLAGRMATATGSPANCNNNNNQIEGRIGTGEYVAVLLTKAGVAIACDAADWRDAISKVKFQGIYQSTTRAIEVAITPKNDSIAWWKFDDGLGSTAIDSSGNSNTGTLQNSPTWMPGRVGSGALSFNGSNKSYVSIDPAKKSNFDFKTTDKFSGCAWVSATSTSSPQVIMSKIGNVNPDYPGWEFNLYNPDTGQGDRLQFYLISKYTAGVFISVVATSATPLGWHYACFTYDGSSNANGVALYLDGSSVPTATKSNTLSSSDSISSSAPFQIGARDGNNLSFSGSIDDVRVYDRTLPSTEVPLIYSSF